MEIEKLKESIVSSLKEAIEFYQCENVYEVTTSDEYVTLRTDMEAKGCHTFSYYEDACLIVGLCLMKIFTGDDAIANARCSVVFEVKDVVYFYFPLRELINFVD